MELVKTLLSAHPDYVRFYQETGLFCDVLPQADVILSGKFKNPTLKLLTHAKIRRYCAMRRCFTMPDRIRQKRR